MAGREGCARKCAARHHAHLPTVNFVRVWVVAAGVSGLPDSRVRRLFPRGCRRKRAKPRTLAMFSAAPHAEQAGGAGPDALSPGPMPSPGEPPAGDDRRTWQQETCRSSHRPRLHSHPNSTTMLVTQPNHTANVTSPAPDTGCTSCGGTCSSSSRSSRSACSRSSPLPTPSTRCTSRSTSCTSPSAS